MANRCIEEVRESMALAYRRARIGPESPRDQRLVKHGVLTATREFQRGWNEAMEYAREFGVPPAPKSPPKRLK